MINVFKRISSKLKSFMANRTYIVLWFLFLGSSLLSGAPIQCASCMETDTTAPMKVVEVLVTAPLDSLQAAKTKELDSLKAKHDSLADKLDSLTKKPFIGKSYHFPWFDKTIHHTYLWYIIDWHGNKKYINSTETQTKQ